MLMPTEGIRPEVGMSGETSERPIKYQAPRASPIAGSFASRSPCLPLQSDQVDRWDGPTAMRNAMRGSTSDAKEGRAGARRRGYWSNRCLTVSR